VGGTYVCRNVADTGRTSMHGWGAAIDINPALADYWLWHRAAGGYSAYVNHIPSDICRHLRATRFHLGRPLGAF
jgi:D-alanyl-D-alanine carboxypeptidase